MIEIKHLKKEYELVTPISDLSATINKGDVISIIGPSGTGKSTLLRMINMLEVPTSGQIFVDGEDITTPGYPLNKLRQKVGMVFQSFNLFNNMTVIENVTYGPIQLKKVDPKEAYEKGMALLNTVGLSAFALSYPRTLSGGQKQRAAIARTLAMEPEIILFDEPTSALDPTMVGEVESVIKKLADQNYTMMLVTHDMNFAKKISNRVFYLDEGGVYEDGTPEQIFIKPTKEKTRVFVKRLRDFDCEITSKDYDFMSLYTELDQFLYKNEVPIEESKKVKAVFEELIFGIILKELNDGITNLKINVSYSDLLKDTRLTANWEGKTIDFANENNKISMDLINHYVSSISFDINSIRLKIKDE